MRNDVILTNEPFVMRGDDPRCQPIHPSPHADNPWWGNTARSILEWAYEIRSRGQYGKSMLVSFGDTFGSGGDSLDYAAMVLGAMAHTLKWDYLIDTVDAIYGGDPESVRQLCDQLSRTCRVSQGQSLLAIESYAVLKAPSTHPTFPERKLHEWHAFALAVLTEEFSGRGWIV